MAGIMPAMIVCRETYIADLVWVRVNLLPEPWTCYKSNWNFCWDLQIPPALWAGVVSVITPWFCSKIVPLAVFLSHMISYSESIIFLWTNCFFSKHDKNTFQNGPSLVENIRIAKPKNSWIFEIHLGIIWGYPGDLLGIFWATCGRSRVHLGWIYGRSMVDIWSI